MKKRTVLITGGAGFIGHHIIRKFLKKTNYNIVSIDRLDYSGSYNRIQQVINENISWSKRLKIVWHDLKAPINSIVRKQLGNPEIILHVAAASHVDRSILDPMSFVLDNVVGTTIYYVTESIGACTSNVSTVTITINDVPAIR